MLGRNDKEAHNLRERGERGDKGSIFVKFWNLSFAFMLNFLVIFAFFADNLSSYRFFALLLPRGIINAVAKKRLTKRVTFGAISDDLFYHPNTFLPSKLQLFNFWSERIPPSRWSGTAQGASRRHIPITLCNLCTRKLSFPIGQDDRLLLFW